VLQNPLYVEDDPQSANVTLKSLIPEDLVAPTTALPVETYAKLLFFLQDELPLIGLHLDKLKWLMNNPSTEEMIAVLVPKTPQQNSVRGKSWSRLLLLYPIAEMNELLNSYVAILQSGMSGFDDIITRLSVATTNLPSLASIQDAIRSCVEQLVGSENAQQEALPAESASLRQQLTRLQREHHELQVQSKGRDAEFESRFQLLQESHERKLVDLQEENQSLKNDLNRLGHHALNQTLYPQDDTKLDSWMVKYADQARLIKKFFFELEDLHRQLIAANNVAQDTGTAPAFVDDF
jgi:hypothetical protein